MKISFLWLLFVLLCLLAVPVSVKSKQECWKLSKLFSSLGRQFICETSELFSPPRYDGLEIFSRNQLLLASGISSPKRMMTTLKTMEIKISCDFIITREYSSFWVPLEAILGGSERDFFLWKNHGFNLIVEHINGFLKISFSCCCCCLLPPHRHRHCRSHCRVLWASSREVLSRPLSAILSWCF